MSSFFFSNETSSLLVTMYEILILPACFTEAHQKGTVPWAPSSVYSSFLPPFYSTHGTCHTTQHLQLVCFCFYFKILSRAMGYSLESQVGSGLTWEIKSQQQERKVTRTTPNAMEKLPLDLMSSGISSNPNIVRLKLCDHNIISQRSNISLPTHILELSGSSA